MRLRREAGAGREGGRGQSDQKAEGRVGPGRGVGLRSAAAGSSWFEWQRRAFRPKVVVAVPPGRVFVAPTFVCDTEPPRRWCWVRGLWRGGGREDGAPRGITAPSTRVRTPRQDAVWEPQRVLTGRGVCHTGMPAFRPPSWG